MRACLIFWQIVIIALLAFGLSGCGQKRVVYLPLSERIGAPLKLDQPTAQFYGRWKEVPYRFGGVSKDGIDCSAFMQVAYLRLYKKRLPRTTSEQVNVGYRVDRKKIRRGDLLFFKTGWGSNHVGMFLGGNYFLHAGESSGVTISELAPSPTNVSDYWEDHFWCARRL